MVCNLALVCLAQLSQLFLLPTCSASLTCISCSLVEWCEKRKRAWRCVSTAQQQRKHSCVINIVSITNPKHTSTLATTKKTNSIPAKTSESWRTICFETIGSTEALLVCKRQLKWYAFCYIILLQCCKMESSWFHMLKFNINLTNDSMYPSCFISLYL